MFLKYNPNICRVCLEQEGKFSLFDKSLIAEQFRFCTLLEATETDELPSSLCIKCYKCLKISNEFKIKATHSDNYLRKFITTLNEKFSNALINQNISKSSMPIDIVINELDSLVTEIHEIPNTTATVAATTTSYMISQTQTTAETFHVNEENLQDDNSIQKIDDASKTNEISQKNYDNIGYRVEIFEYNEDDDNDNDYTVMQQLCDDIVREQEINENEIHHNEKTNEDNEIQNNIDTDNVLTIEKINDDDEDVQQLCDIIEEQEINKSEFCHHYEETNDEENEIQKNNSINSGNENDNDHDDIIDSESEPHDNDNNDNDENDENDKCSNDENRKNNLEHNKMMKNKYKNFLINQKNKLNKNNNSACLCVECNKTFSSTPNLMRHLLTHENAKPYQCNECGDCFTQNSSLKTHMLRHTGQRPYECNVCHKKFTRKPILTKHSLIHAGVKPYKCEECHKQFRVKESLKRHKLKHSKIKLLKEYPCSICDRILSTKHTLEMHMKIHRGEKEYVKCNICNKSFVNKYTLKYHLKIHDRQKEKSEQDKFKKNVKVSSKSSTSQEQHIQKQHNNKNDTKISVSYKCNICNEYFLRKFKYFEHLLTHENENILNYCCRKCNKMFTVKENLIEHLRAHIDFIFKCDKCNIGFNKKRELKLHNLNIHKINTKNLLNTCDDCDVTFTTGIDLNNHILNKHDNTDIVCDECGKYFISNNLYKEHTIEHNIIELSTKNYQLNL